MLREEKLAEVPNAERREARVISINWQHFSASLVFAVLFPLMPLAIEFIFAGSISDNSILIASIMYCSAIALASDSVLVLALGFLAAIVLSIPFGITFYNNQIAPSGSQTLSLVCIGFFGLSHILQRYNQHVVRGEDFISLRKRDEES